MLAKVANKDTRSVVSCAHQNRQEKLPSELYKSLTWDRGKELSDHRRFNVDDKHRRFIFCDPQSPWQARLE